MASYCSKECQKAAYAEHKMWCKQSLDFAAKSEGEARGKRRILFSRSFGGAVSLMLMEVYRRRQELGRGVLHADCSHPFVDYLGRRRTNCDDHRTIKLTWIPEGQPLMAFQEARVGTTQAKSDGDGDGMLQIAVKCHERFCKQMEEGVGELDTGLAGTIALEQKGARFLHAIQFISYLSADHSAHNCFRHTLRNGGAEQQQQDGAHHFSMTLDWDWHPRDMLTRSPIQYLFHNSIGSRFFQQCSLAWQEKDRTKDSSPWPGGVR